MSGSFHAAKWIKLPVTNTTYPNQPDTYKTWANVLQGTTIPSGATASGVVDISSGLGFSITCPANLQGVATITIQHSDFPNGTFTTVNQQNSATVYTITLTASRTVPVDSTLLAGLGYIKLIPNTAPGADLALQVNVKAAA